MMNPPTLTVGITYYNEGALLTACLQSLYANSMLPTDVFVYDDASSDPAEQYLRDFPQVKLIRASLNRGPGYARDQLINASTSDYVHLHDADDLFEPEWCFEVFNAIEQGRPDMILTDLVLLDEDSGTVREYWTAQLRTVKEARQMQSIFFRKAIIPSILTFQRELALRIGGHRWREVISMSEDVDFSRRMLIQAERPTYIDKKLILKHQRLNSYSQIHDEERFRHLYDASHLKSRLFIHAILGTDWDREKSFLLRNMAIIFLNPHSVPSSLYKKAQAYLDKQDLSVPKDDTSQDSFPRHSLDTLSRVIGFRTTFKLWKLYHKMRELIYPIPLPK